MREARQRWPHEPGNEAALEGQLVAGDQLPKRQHSAMVLATMVARHHYSQYRCKGFDCSLGEGLVAGYACTTQITADIATPELSHTEAVHISHHLDTQTDAQSPSGPGKKAPMAHNIRAPI